MATQIQSNVSDALQTLGLEYQENDMPGSPQELKVTKNTISKLENMLDATVIVDGDGSIKVRMS